LLIAAFFRSVVSLDVFIIARPSGPSAQAAVQVDKSKPFTKALPTWLNGFSGGGYNARLIWQELSAAERDRIRKVVVIGSPGVEQADFLGSSDVVIKPDPPEGHMAGPKALLNSIQPEISKASR
jgi:hypothetical protein